MIAGLIFVVAGILIAVYPPLLSLIVASVLIFTGVGFLLISYQYKKLTRSSENPLVDFFIRF